MARNLEVTSEGIWIPVGEHFQYLIDNDAVSMGEKIYYAMFEDKSKSTKYHKISETKGRVTEGEN